MQTPVGPVISASVSLTSYELCSVALEDLVLLVSSILSDSYTLSVFLLQGSLSIEGRDLTYTSQLELCVPSSLSHCIMSECGSLIFLSSAA